MLPLVGFILIITMVFIPYTLGGGSIEIIIHACAIEGPTIVGASFGAFLISNTPDILKRSFKDVKLCFKGPHWKKEDFSDMLCLMFGISKLMKQKGLQAIESHVEKPQESLLFAPYPRLLADNDLTNMICDTIRILTMSLTDSNQIEDILNKQLEKRHNELTSGVTALQTAADGLPAIGIVAAVLGVIKTMASIDKPPNILGAMIGGALVGTFLGVFFSYCVVGPIASKAKILHDKNALIYLIFREVIISHMKGNVPQVSVEMARSVVPTLFQPSFFELEEALREVKIS